MFSGHTVQQALFPASLVEAKDCSIWLTCESAPLNCAEERVAPVLLVWRVAPGTLRLPPCWTRPSVTRSYFNLFNRMVVCSFLRRSVLVESCMSVQTSMPPTHIKLLAESLISLCQGVPNHRTSLVAAAVLLAQH